MQLGHESPDVRSCIKLWDLSNWPLILNMIEFQDQIVYRPLSFSSHIKKT